MFHKAVCRKHFFNVFYNGKFIKNIFKYIFERKIFKAFFIDTFLNNPTRQEAVIEYQIRQYIENFARIRTKSEKNISADKKNINILFNSVTVF